MFTATRLRGWSRVACTLSGVSRRGRDNRRVLQVGRGPLADPRQTDPTPSPHRAPVDVLGAPLGSIDNDLPRDEDPPATGREPPTTGRGPPARGVLRDPNHLSYLNGPATQ